ncbi:hypothetical protein LX32DRAFT_261717 [Colletotrichum zoysiae]|uniref:Uncharacterized protein n=1 Tax=Colletotrichum zoysiae TaxID=1216348 RepID=A0AAD9HPB8_9PEZI|nr:hypothetical protein LX32DRAFT_261717 [Colletotrichum zoysiae]
MSRWQRFIQTNPTNQSTLRMASHQPINLKAKVCWLTKLTKLITGQSRYSSAIQFSVSCFLMGMIYIWYSC